MTDSRIEVVTEKQGPKVPVKKLEYDIDSMKKAIEKCNESIKIFEDAIAKEQATQKEYRRIISVLEEQLSECKN